MRCETDRKGPTSPLQITQGQDQQWILTPESKCNGPGGPTNNTLYGGDATRNETPRSTQAYPTPKTLCSTRTQHTNNIKTIKPPGSVPNCLLAALCINVKGIYGTEWLQRIRGISNGGEAVYRKSALNILSMTQRRSLNPMEHANDSHSWPERMPVDEPSNLIALSQLTSLSSPQDHDPPQRMVTSIQTPIAPQCAALLGASMGLKNDAAG